MKWLSKISCLKCQLCADGEGTCFGPNICCSSEMGCLINTKESEICKQEDLTSNQPCKTYGKKCDNLEYGQCATNGLCCNSGLRIF